MTGALPDHHLVRGEGAVDDAPLVDVYDPLPVVEVHVLDFAADTDARIVEDIVQSSALGGCLVDEAPYVFLVRYVQFHGLGSSARGLQARRYISCLFLVDVGNHHMGPVLPEFLTEALADP